MSAGRRRNAAVRSAMVMTDATVARQHDPRLGPWQSAWWTGLLRLLGAAVAGGLVAGILVAVLIAVVVLWLVP